jgi:ribosome-binding factor A
MAKNKFDNSGAPSQRQLRVGELIRRTLSEVLTRGEIHDPDLNRLYLSIGEVRVSPDLRIATVYALPLGGDKKEEAIAALKRNKGELRHALGKKLTLRFSPELRFLADDTYDQIDATKKLLAQDVVRRDAQAPSDDAED